MAANPRSRKTTAAVVQESRQCLDLRLTGLSYQQIADRMDISTATAHRRVTDAIEATIFPAADQVRKQELMRLDQLYLRLLQQSAREGDIAKVAPHLLRVQERRSKLLGLDAPERAQIQVTETTQADLAIQDLLSEARAKAELEAAALAVPVDPAGVPGQSDGA
jgi:transposase